MDFEIELNNTIVKVELENRKNIKHCYLRILKQNLIQIKANRYFTLNDAKILVQNRRKWLEENLQKVKEKSLNEDEFLLFGKREKLENFNIKNLDIFYKNEIKKYIPSLVEKYSNLMQLYPTKISYRKNKRTWGSCNYKNELNFNILLMKYPLFVAEYIVVHELSHIKHKNHSRDFWNLVEKYSPNYKEIEKIFKALL
ncbi:M48 family metallopeptidase [Arcobacter lanthieri]|uniref:M48 family metallopeptidase n=1 Tax=Aliarcobacter lanthieri TaxID=1355374 RepID=UPI001923028C|nr:YgjP-like metallopeptidase domain-containing protein [Aliarcobacter lanthieri]MBL3520917.1 M48 family metallopeptidase [Aliarcobacter lanthieri]